MLDTLFSIPKLIVVLVTLAFFMTLFTGYRTWLARENKTQLETRAAASATTLVTEPTEN